MAQRDWIDGDTIEVLFVPVERVGPTAVEGAQDEEAYEVERIIARIGARSLYRLEPSDSLAVAGVDPPALSYVVADRITIFMIDGQADRVESIGQVSGWHLEPLRREPGEDADPDAEEPLDGAPGTNGSVPATNDRGDAEPPDAYLFRGL
jgi:hypothetical protein